MVLSPFIIFLLLDLSDTDGILACSPSELDVAFVMKKLSPSRISKLKSFSDIALSESSSNLISLFFSYDELLLREPNYEILMLRLPCVLPSDKVSLVSRNFIWFINVLFVIIDNLLDFLIKLINFILNKTLRNNCV